MSFKTETLCSLGLVFKPARIFLNLTLFFLVAGTSCAAEADFLPQDSQIYQIHTPAFFQEKGRATFDDFSTHEIKQIADYGFNVIWMTGIWQPSEASRRHNLDQEDPNNPGRIANIYAIPEYKVNASLGGEEAFQGFVRRAAAARVRVMVDFIPGHHSMDSPLLEKHPDWFFFRKEPPASGQEHWFHPAKSESGEAVWFHFAGDAHPWTDMIAFNYLNPEVWRYLNASLERLAVLTNGGGLRIDALGLLEPEKYRKKWFPELSQEAYRQKMEAISKEVFGRPLDASGNLFKTAFEALKQKYPQIILLGEVYEKQDEWHAAAVDLTYNKGFLDALASDPKKAPGFIRAYFFNNHFFKLEDDYLFKQLHFLENHDENQRILNRMAVYLKKEKPDLESAELSNLLAVAMATLPGAPLVYRGQETGAWLSGPNAYWVSSKREEPDLRMSRFYRGLFRKTNSAIFRRGSWIQVPVQSPAGGASALAFARIASGKAAVVAFNFSGSKQSVTLNLSALNPRRKKVSLSLKPWGYEVKYLNVKRSS